MLFTICVGSALLGTVCLAGVYLTETIMAGVGFREEERIYNRPSQGMAISNILNLLMAICLYVFMPRWYSSDPPLDAVALSAISGMICTACSVLYMLIYYDEDKQGEDTVALASASACTPAIVSIFSFMGRLVGFHDESCSWLKIAGAILATVSMMLFASFGKARRSRGKKRILYLCVFAILAALYGQVMDESILRATVHYQREGTPYPAIAGYLSTYLWYWIGNCLTILWLLQPGEWKELRLKFPMIWKNRTLILFSEGLQTVAFSLRLFAYTGASAVVVMTICSTLPIWVWLGNTVMRTVFRYSGTLFKPVSNPEARVIIILMMVIAIGMVING